MSMNESTNEMVNEPNTQEMNNARGHNGRAWLKRYGVWLTLAAILLLAAILRFPSVEMVTDKETGEQTLELVSWDGDHHLHPDERFLTMVSSAIRLPGSVAEYFNTAESPMNPYNNNFGSFVYGTAPLFVVRIAAEVVRQTDYWNIHLVGRVMSALFDLFTCAMVFFIGRRLFHAGIGLFAAFLYACAVLPIQQSHFMTVDAFGNVPIVLAFWFTLDIMEGKRGWLAYALAGAALGLAVASRINFLMFAAIVVLAALLRLVTLLGSVKRVGLAANETRTYAMDAESVISGQSSVIGQTSNVIGQTRTITLGPIVIEVETRARSDARAGEAQTVDTTSFWNAVIHVGTGLIVCALAALFVFRIGQPYAFTGLFSLNPKWLDDMKFISELISGQIDFPPSHQWTGRAAYLFPLYNMFLFGMGVPFAFAAWAGFLVGLYEILRFRKWNHLLIALWIGGFFLYQAQQFVLVVRYYLPLYPFLAIYAAFFIFWLFDRAKELQLPWRRLARVATVVFGGIVVGYALFWAFAFTSIYTRPVTRIAASDWLRENVARDAKIANEHWDDPIPFGGYEGLKTSSDGLMQMYGEDGEEKREQVKQWLNEADYIVLTSNRLYGSIPRLPRRFPMTTKYYQWLFAGELGFEKIQEFTSYPQLFGIVINDDSSDEAFTVYDHPKVTIFKKTADYSAERVAELLDSVDLSELEKLKPIDAVASKNGFRMSPELQAANYAGGTWSQIFNPNDFVNSIPVVAWLVAVWAIGILAFPYTFVAFRRFADRGYAFTKMVGVLALAWLTWTLASYRVLPFERTTMLLVLAILVAGALFVVWRKRAEMTQYLRAHWKLLVGIEILYLVFFAMDLAIRYGNPDLWHPWFGGEKPMDFAYLNAVIKSTYFPAYNPWFEGGFINYYYFGQLISATLVKLTGIVPEVAYNVLLPMFFAMTASGAFGVAYNIVARAMDKGRTTGDESQFAIRNSQFPIRPILAGIVAAFLVLIIGNLGQVGVLFKGLTDLGNQGGAEGGIAAFVTGLFAWLGGKEIPVPIGNWYWTATRIIPDTINEIPFFTFVYADLHAHLMSLPFALLGLGVAAHAVFNRGKLKWYDLGIAALVLGALRAINTWDYPTYLALLGCAMVLGYFAERRTQNPEHREFDWSEFIQRYLLFIVLGFVQVAVIVIPTNAAGTRITFDMGMFGIVLVFALVMGILRSGVRFDPRAIGWDLGWRMIALIALSVLFYWPYIANYGTAYTSVELWKDDRTALSDYLVVHGIFLFLVATYLVLLVANKTARTQQRASDESSISIFDGWMIYLLPALAVLEVGLIFVGLQVFAVVLPLVAAAVWILLRDDTAPVHRFLALVLTAALLLTLMVEAVTLKGDIGRMNTVFKFYLQAWVFFGVASASGLAIVFHHLWFRDPKTDEATRQKIGGDSPVLQTLKAAWWGLGVLLIFAGALYPAFAAWAKVNDRFPLPNESALEKLPPGLNGLDYMQHVEYQEGNSTLKLAQDYHAIQWLRENIIGSPVIVEANTGLYRWGNRVSINTGLPVVIGWDWHTKQQYSLLPGEIIDNRIQAIRDIYESGSADETMELLKKYNVSLVYVGPLERAVYDAANFNKFDNMVREGMLQKIYDADGVEIYAVAEKVAQVVK